MRYQRPIDAATELAVALYAARQLTRRKAGLAYEPRAFNELRTEERAAEIEAARRVLASGWVAASGWW